jgi:hypothetical protein
MEKMSHYNDRKSKDFREKRKIIMCLRTVLRIRDIYPGSRILIFTHPGSRTPDPKQQQKIGVKKNLLSYLPQNSQIENYFSFEVLKKKFGPIFKEL